MFGGQVDSGAAPSPDWRDMTHSVGTLLDELDIPRAISAPPQLDDRWALHLGGLGGQSTDIRLDEDYDRFYRAQALSQLSLAGRASPALLAQQELRLVGTFKYSTLEEVAGKVAETAKDQLGCRFLQKKFDEGGGAAVEVVFGEILESLVELMVDPFGNYLVQKLLDRCSEEQRLAVLKRVAGGGELVEVALNTHGTRAMELVIQALRPGVVALIRDLNGNHVIQRCLQRMTNEDLGFVYAAAADHCLDIATHRHGCCVLQRCIDRADAAQKRHLAHCIAAHALILSQDPFGNYVVQYVLEQGNGEMLAPILAQLKGHYAELAVQKFSSNVVERCLKLGGGETSSLLEERDAVVEELMTSPSFGRLLQDPYANYVMQSALSVTSGARHAALVEAIRPFLPALRGTPHGKRILAKIAIKV
ncbi:Putative pumilio-like protein 8, chloroplastic [Auxenochlorella protothecoides]|uniref:Putative pumilio-like protein 8, chloroplastic n=1 Tax=Auxenochlorella protothecoides TaxID=3075 RepID=A0A087SNW4_AUXPR|nr:Putative pumilio-like protein 8, chloroplastic [Auxenochlorella protothecoides]KFM27418.1 Putative pumilio-like protein 8, chloroplastic [Auxenochlorella protothecoides]